MEKWVVSAKRADFAKIGQMFHIDQVTARIMRNRDVIDEEDMRIYLYGTLDDLHDPKLLDGCAEAAELLKKKIMEQKKIRIIGDYDVDGVNSVCILYSGLQMLGANVDYEIPDRMKDGYGLNLRLIEQAYENGVDTILTCDNGISAIEQIAYAKQLGMTVVVTDHHEPLFDEEHSCVLPQADVLVDPALWDCRYPYRKICGAVVAWKMLQVLFAACGRKMEETYCFLCFAAIATIVDVMELTGENRLIVKYGLKALESSEHPGLHALMRLCGIPEDHVTAESVAFKLGPCLNASGRLDTAKRSLKLLLCEQESEALELAQELFDLNVERRALTSEGTQKAIELVETTDLYRDHVLVVYLPDCHESIAGLIAGNLRERYYKPVIVLTDAEGCAKGSGRSIEAYSMFEELMKCQDLLIKMGGHPMAAGLSINRDMISQFRKRLNEECRLTEEDMVKKVLIDVPMPINYISEGLIEDFSILEPFGKGNRSPLFAEKDLQIVNIRRVGRQNQVLKLQLLNHQGCCMDAVYFGDVDQMMDYLTQKYGAAEVEKALQGRYSTLKLAVTYHPSVNVYRDARSLQIVIHNYQ